MNSIYEIRLGGSTTYDLYYQDMLEVHTMLSPKQMGAVTFSKASDTLFSNHNHKCKRFDPMECPLGNEEIELLNNYKSKDYLFFSIPLIIKRNYLLYESSHLVHLLIKKSKPESIEFFDPKNYSLDTYPEVEEVIDKIKSATSDIFEHREAVQYVVDFVNCGAYVLSYLEQRVVDELPFSKYIKEPNEGIVGYRTELAKKMANYLSIKPKQKEPDEVKKQEIDNDQDQWVILEKESEF